MRESRLFREPKLSFLTSGILFLFAALAVYPIIFIFLVSVMTEKQFSTDRLAFLFDPTMSNIVSAYTKMRFWEQLSNTAITTLGGVLGTWIVCIPATYAIVYTNIPLRRTIAIVVFGSMLVPTQGIVAPLSSLLTSLNLMDSRIGLMMTFVAFACPLTLYQLCVFAKSIPEDVFDAARLDGANPLQLMSTILTPCLRPALAITGVMNFVWMWNDLILPVLLMHDPANRTLVVGVGLLKGQWGSSATELAAGVVLSIIPVLAVFIIGQRQLVSGLTAGSVK